MQYTSSKRQKTEGKTLINTTNVLLLVYLLAFSILGLISYTSSIQDPNKSLSSAEFIGEVFMDNLIGKAWHL